jgi:NTP pyrophosphatase (non-canonical NTP hydrolase)
VKETQASIYQWAREQFGDPKSIFQIAERAAEEMSELFGKIADDAPRESIVEEIADVVIVLSQIAERLGLDLGEAIDRKMAINRAREWVTAGDGTGQHVEGVTNGR